MSFSPSFRRGLKTAASTALLLTAWSCSDAESLGQAPVEALAKAAHRCGIEEPFPDPSSNPTGWGRLKAYIQAHEAYANAKQRGASEDENAIFSIGQVLQREVNAEVATRRQHFYESMDLWYGRSCPCANTEDCAPSAAALMEKDLDDQGLFEIKILTSAAKGAGRALLECALEEKIAEASTGAKTFCGFWLETRPGHPFWKTFADEQKARFEIEVGTRDRHELYVFWFRASGGSGCR